MENDWTLSPALIALLKERMADPRTVEIMPPGVKSYPIIGWVLRGVLSRPGEPPIEVGPHYGLGLMATLDVPDCIHIPDETFDVVLFTPSDEDKNSGRRNVHYDGTDIVVR